MIPGQIASLKVLCTPSRSIEGMTVGSTVYKVNRHKCDGEEDDKVEPGIAQRLRPSC